MVHITDLDEARLLYSQLNRPILLDKTDRKTLFEWRSNRVLFGPLELCELVSLRYLVVASLD